jgi:hypothetical protein
VNYTVTPPGYPSEATVINRMALPFLQPGPLHIEGGGIYGQSIPLYDPLYNQTLGDYTRH